MDEPYKYFLMGFHWNVKEVTYLKKSRDRIVKIIK